jgi:DNA-binding transcriptional ArsR family regulator
MSMDAVFRALADKTRRRLLDRLRAKSGQTMNELCNNAGMSRQAVAKLLAILEGANLVAVQWEGREKRHYLNPVPINDIAERWVAKYENARLTALSALKRAMERDKT